MAVGVCSLRSVLKLVPVGGAKLTGVLKSLVWCLREEEGF